MITTERKTDTKATLIKMVLDRWNTELRNFNEKLNSLKDEDLQKEIAPGRNRGIYLLGHLVAVHDAMLPLLGLGEKLFPELEEPFLTSPDKAIAALPPVSELRAAWSKVNETLAAHFADFTTDDWFDKHTAVSQEEFVNEPHRNKLNIVLTRTSHLTYHRGQFILIR